MISRAIWDFNGWDREEIHKYYFLAKGVKGEPRLPALSATQCRTQTREIQYVTHTFIQLLGYTSYGKGDTISSYLRWVGLVLFYFYLFIVYCLCILFFTMHGFRGFCQGRHQGEDVGKTV